MELVAVPGSDTALYEAVGGIEDVVALAEDLVVRRVAVAAARLVAGDGVWYAADVQRP
jgi:hypothetical protein